MHLFCTFPVQSPKHFYLITFSKVPSHIYRMYTYIHLPLVQFTPILIYIPNIY